MRVVLVIAAAALLYAAEPAGAVPARAGSNAGCAAGAAHATRAGRPAVARRGAARRAAARRRCGRATRARRGETAAGRAGAPSSFAAQPWFATAPTAETPAPETAPPAPGEPAGPALPPVYSNPRAVQVRAYEFRFQLSKSTVSAGSVSVEFNLSAAEDPHDLWLVREDGAGPAYSFGETPAGVVARQSFALTTGRWTLFCSLTGHQAAGMRSTLTVG
jgi:plastocyanin